MTSTTQGCQGATPYPALVNTDTCTPADASTVNFGPACSPTSNPNSGLDPNNTTVNPIVTCDCALAGNTCLPCGSQENFGTMSLATWFSTVVGSMEWDIVNGWVPNPVNITAVSSSRHQHRRQARRRRPRRFAAISAK